MRTTLLSVAAILLFFQSFGQGVPDEVIFQGNKIQFTKGKLAEHEPYLLNGERVVTSQPEADSAFHVVSAAIMPVIKEEMLKMGKGWYCIDINNILINKKGRVVYYEMLAPSPFSCTAPLRKGVPLTGEQELLFKIAIDKVLLNMMVFQVTQDGTPVAYLNRAISGELVVNE